MAKNKDNDQWLAKNLAKDIARLGGRSFYVGGYVRDKLMGTPSKDIDLEIYGIKPEVLRAICANYGEVQTQGASFGILNIKGYDVDIAQPRKERATGKGHKDFEVYVDPDMRPEDAARRRDFTINSLMEDVVSGEIIDPYGGQADLENRLIHHVNDRSFAEDPLRVLRAAQFAARFDFRIHPDTIALCKTLSLNELSRERIAGELNKAILKADKPSVFFETLREMGQLHTWFPEVEALINLPQSPEYHPEGDVWTHTMQVMDSAASLSHDRPDTEKRNFILAALCHDFGKAVTTGYDNQKQKLISHGHEAAGAPIAQGFIDRVYKEKDLTKYVMNLTEMHMQPRELIHNNSKSKSFMRMFDKSVSPRDLVDISYCDGVGRASKEQTPDIAAEDRNREKLLEWCGKYEELMKKPQVRGDDLIAIGYKPGRKIGEMLRMAHKIHLSGVKKEDAIRQIIGTFGEPEKTDKQQKIKKNENITDKTLTNRFMIDDIIAGDSKADDIMAGDADIEYAERMFMEKSNDRDNEALENLQER